MNKRDILMTAADLVSNDRANVYGDSFEMHLRIAKYWSLYLGIELTPLDVAHLMVLFKFARATVNPAHTDSYVDQCGYGACAGEIASILFDTTKQGEGM